MPRKVTKYTEPTGWPHVQATYDEITYKLDELPKDKSQRLEAIKYWKNRLEEDRKAIEADGEPLVSP